MSWLGSLANSLRLDDDDAENDTVPTNSKQDNSHNEETKPSSPSPQQQQQQQKQNEDEEEDQGEELEEGEEEEELQSRGVKEDLTELKQTLTRQLWGVASFLAPPPEASQSEIRGDLAEIGGRFTEISKMASNYFLFGSEESEEYEEEEEEEGNSNSNSAAVGITDEVLAFAMNIAMHPETWLDFPLDPEEDLDDFEMSDMQQEHALAIERLSPQLNALRIELCPCHMSEGYFWKVYFVLLHSRLNKHDAEILSSPQVMEARAMWMQELQKKTKPETDWYGRSTSYLKDSTNLVHEDLISSSNYAPFESMSPRTYASERTTSTMTTDYETEKYLVESTETQFVDKSVIEERPVSKTEDKDLLVGPSSKILIPNFEDDEDDWPDEDSELGGYSGRVICVGTDEDVSFSDLEDFDDGRLPMKSKIVSKGTT